MMLNECDFSDLPPWARQELLQTDCPNFSWSTISYGQQSVTVADPSRAYRGETRDEREEGTWTVEVALAFRGEYTSSGEIVDRFRSGQTDRLQSVRFHFAEPLFDLFVRIGLNRPKPSVLALNPTAYTSLRVVPGQPIVFSNDWHDSGHAPDGGSWQTKRSISLVFNLALWRLDDWFDDIPWDLPAEWSFTPSSVWDSDLFYEVIDAVTDAYYFSLSSTGSEEYSYEYFGHDAIGEFLWSIYLFSGERIEIDFDWPEDYAIPFEDLYPPLKIDVVDKISRGEVDLVVSLTEAKRTGKMVYDRLKVVYDALVALKTRNIGALKRLLRRERRHKKNSVESLFLEYNFGWRQLYNDLNGALQTMFNNMYYNGQRFKVRSEQISDPRLIQFYHAPHLQTSSSWWEFDSRSVKLLRGSLPPQFAQKPLSFNLKIGPNPTDSMRALILRSNWKITDSRLKILSDLGIKNPFIGIWDVVPYSFIVDWVFNIDSILKSLTYDSGAEQEANVLTYVDYTPLVVKVNELSDGDPVTIHRSCPAYRLIVGRGVSEEVSYGVTPSDVIRSALPPTKMFQLSVLAAMIAQKANGILRK